MACILTGIYVLLLICVAAGSQLPEYKARYRRGVGHCQECGYDLVGLADGTTCPECGRPDAGAPETVVARRIIKPLVSRRLLAITAFVGVGSLLYGWAVSLAGAWTYLAQGYRLDVAIRASEIRTWDLGLIWLVNPWPCAVVLAPVLAMQPEGPEGERKVWLTLAGALLAGVVCLAVLATFWR